MNKEIETLLSEQLSSWETAQNNYAALKRVRIKDVKVNGCLYRIQFNPARIVSSAAKVDSKSIQERKCFLCPANLPPMQRHSFRRTLPDIGQPISYLSQALDSSRATTC